MPELLLSSTLAAAFVFTAATTSMAQTAKDLAGTWSVVSAVEDKEGKKSDFFGSNPQAMMMLDGNGHFMQIIMRDDLPRFAANGRELATEQEAKAVVQGAAAYYGTYTVPGDGKLIFHVARATFPNWNGMEQQRTYKINDDGLMMVNPANFTAGEVQSVWKRVK